MQSIFHSLFAVGMFLPSLREHAYLDPGSGSLLIQMLLALLLAVPFLIKGYWRKIKAKLTHSTEEMDGETPDESGQQQ